MTSETTTAAHELTLTRIIDAPREKLYKAWTDPDIMKKWFCPPPWRVTHAELDVRCGGTSYVLMEGPDGQQAPNRGIYLEVIPNEKIVFTDAFTSAWVPSEKAFIVATVLFENIGEGKTRYSAKVLHWSAEDKKAHEDMGFHEGWGIATDQLAEVAKTI